ncbi:NFACT RNA binding domain-containing protein [Gracilimonas sp.]|uniref:NFACT RNA binding domain-containing protein n=1 Tax=Gracilimonas sp. TaxID=1974203 RepID=UPI0028725208|nr:NFACT RNA binding domain-containing protein [Gracilimonas sp.]
MNYYELIYLNRRFKNKLIGGYIDQSVSPYKNYIEFFIQAGDEKLRLCYSSAPGNTALFLDSYRGAKKSNTIDFFEAIYSTEIKEVHIPETDRWLCIDFENGYRLSFRLFSNRANVFLSKDGVITEVFKEYDKPGDQTPEPQWLDLYEVEGDISRKSTKNKLTALNPMLPRQNLKDLIEIHELEDASQEELKKFVKSICEEMEENATFRLLENGETTLLSKETLPLKTEKIFDDVNDLIRYRYKNYSRSQRLKQRKSSLIKSLKRKIKRKKSGLQNLDQAEKGLERAEKYEKWGHILMANAHLGHVNKEEIEVEDLYDEGKKVKIPLKRELDIAQNAERYYDKSAGAEKSYEEAQKRIPKMQKELEEAEQLLEEAQNITNLWDFQDWEKEKEQELQPYRDQGGNSDEGDQLPFHTLEIKGYPVWIGKNAKSNDQLVQQAHKEDVWMHARKVAGSHLVIRMANDKGMPPKDVLLEAASYAAYNSKARGSKLAPVIITKTKYVRKPKGSPPGAVVVDKEDVEMVTPKKP